MKYLLIFILTLFFISPNISDCTSFSQVIKSGIYNYITCLDKSFDYLNENVPAFNQITKIPYIKTYEEIMSNRYFVKHFVKQGQTLDDIIKTYNKDIENIEKFRKVVHKKNPNVISRDYNLKSGEYILVPSE